MDAREMKPSERITGMIERFADEWIDAPILPSEEDKEMFVAALTKLVDEAVREAILTTAKVFSKERATDETI